MTEPDDLQTLSALVGAPVVAADRSPWGFENRTDIVTLADGRRLVVQRITNRALAARKLRLGAELPDRLAQAGIRFPRQIRTDAEADPPYAIREYLPGLPGALLMGEPAGAVAVAGAMGPLLPPLARVATDGAELDATWAAPQTLARAAAGWLEACAPLLRADERRALADTIAQLDELFAGRPTVFAHGDFCPVNVLLDERAVEERDTNRPPAVVALLDVEFARLADPLFDAAWWGWVVRYHHAERWVRAWPVLLRAAGLPDNDATAARIGAIQRLRCLEFIDEMRGWNDRAAAMWHERLTTTIGWDSPRSRPAA